MSNGTNDDDKKSSDLPDVSRRRILYAAPILMSQKMFNSGSGCGKVDPTYQSCALVAMSS